MKAKWMPLAYQRRKGKALFPNQVVVMTEPGQTESVIKVVDADESVLFSLSPTGVLAPSGVINADLVKLHAITASAAQLNGLTQALFVDTTVTVAQVNAGATIVPAITGKQFFPTFCAMVSTGAAADATLVRLVEETSNGVVMSHVIADLGDGVWAGPSGGTVVTTLLGTALVANKAVLINKTGSTLTGTTAMRVIVAGYYI